MEKSSSIQTLIFFLITIPGAWLAWTLSGRDIVSTIWAILWVGLIAIVIASAFKVADQWEKAVLLRLGRYFGLKGPGPFLFPYVTGDWLHEMFTGY